ncbi:MAG TPA: hypothetical protein PKE39_16480 [Ignavibacteria bacterium]|nr:hypothetical protein [Ignavibacteria bacterium]HMR00621.1 hypothetical protein [Ignavibacteria bacterium]
MKISDKTKKTIEELYVYSGNKLKNVIELMVLIELAEQSGKDKLFYDIQFAAKYLNGLGRILQSNVALTTQKKPGSNGEEPPTADEAREKIMGEYKANMIKLTNYLKDLLLDADEADRKEIEEKYLSLSRTSMVNLTTLIYDLSWLKRYLNSKR